MYRRKLYFSSIMTSVSRFLTPHVMIAHHDLITFVNEIKVICFSCQFQVYQSCCCIPNHCCSWTFILWLWFSSSWHMSWDWCNTDLSSYCFFSCKFHEFKFLLCLWYWSLYCADNSLYIAFCSIFVNYLFLDTAYFLYMQ